MKGEVRALHKEWAFIQVKFDQKTRQEVKRTFIDRKGFFCCKAKEIQLAGHDFTKKVQV